MALNAIAPTIQGSPSHLTIALAVMTKIKKVMEVAILKL